MSTATFPQGILVIVLTIPAQIPEENREYCLSIVSREYDDGMNIRHNLFETRKIYYFLKVGKKRFIIFGHPRTNLLDFLSIRTIRVKSE